MPPNAAAVQRRRLKATTVPRSRRPSQTTTVENASGVRCNGWVGRPVLVCCNCTTLGTPLFRGHGRPGPRRWQAIDGFRSVQRFCPSKPSKRSHRGFRATARRKAVPSGKPIPCGGSTCGREEPVPLGSFSKKDRWKGEESPRVGPYFGRGRQSPEGQTPGSLRGARREMFEGHQRFPEGVAERRDTDASGATDLTIGRSRQYLPVEQSPKEIQAG